jgi:CHAD domain-containing protein
MKLKSSRNAAENARALLPKLAEKYFKAGRRAAADRERSPKQLHRFRLATKRFRYSLELFRPVYGPSLDRQLSALRGLQGVLGKLSDYHTVQTVLAGDQALEAKLEHATKKKLKEFRDLWAAFGSLGACERWKAYLAKVPVKRKPAR